MLPVFLRHPVLVLVLVLRAPYQSSALTVTVDVSVTPVVAAIVCHHLLRPTLPPLRGPSAVSRITGVPAIRAANLIAFNLLSMALMTVIPTIYICSSERGLARIDTLVAPHLLSRFAQGASLELWCVFVYVCARVCAKRDVLSQQDLPLARCDSPGWTTKHSSF